MKKLLLATLVGLVVSGSLFAMPNDDDNCKVIAKACKNAGFKRKEGSGKEFWHNCMKPVIMGQQVKGINVPADQIKSCRDSKIAAMQEELKELQSVS